MLIFLLSQLLVLGIMLYMIHLGINEKEYFELTYLSEEGIV